MRRAVEVLCEPGGVVELRAIKNGSTAAGYFDDVDILSRMSKASPSTSPRTL
jgi:hypothetical protein